MKDVSHHLRQIQRKIIRLSRQESINTQSNEINGSVSSKPANQLIMSMDNTIPPEKKAKPFFSKNKKIFNYH
jgi:hypothetical protein